LRRIWAGREGQGVVWLEVCKLREARAAGAELLFIAASSGKKVWRRVWVRGEVKVGLLHLSAHTPLRFIYFFFKKKHCKMSGRRRKKKLLKKSFENWQLKKTSSPWNHLRGSGSEEEARKINLNYWTPYHIDVAQLDTMKTQRND
jgi:hypothetical protein